MRPTFRQSTALFTALATGFCFSPALSQSAGSATEIEEVIVTSRKRAESLADVPIAVTAFTATDIQDAGITRPEDFISLTPNVVMVNTANAGDTQVTIRGITSTRDAESNFALVVDGVLITNPNSFNQELFAIEQIEVLKGPQGALYGRNASSGAILITTSKPGEDAVVKLTAEAATQGGTRIQGVFSSSLGDSMAGQIAFSSRSADGFEDNLFTGQSGAIDYFEDFSTRGRLVLDLGKGELDLRARISEVSGGAINFNAVFALPGFATAFSNPQYFANVNEHPFQYFPNIRPENDQSTLDFSVSYRTELGASSQLTVVGAFNSLDESLLSDGTSGSFSVYNHVQECIDSLDTPDAIRLINGFPGSYTNGKFEFVGGNSTTLLGPYTPTTCDGYQYQERNQSDFSVEVRVEGGNDSLSWVGGGYLALIDREVVVSYGADLGTPILKQPYVEGVTDLLFWDDFSTTVYSAFGQAVLNLTSGMELALEGRFDIEDREVSNKVPKASISYLNSGAFGGRTTADTGPINPARANVNDDIPARSESFSQFQPKVSLRFNLSEGSRLYTSYGVGFRSGGFNSLGSNRLIDENFNIAAIGANLSISDQYDKEVSTAIEVGYKGRFLDGKLRLNAAIFQTSVENNQFFEFFAGPFGLMRVVSTIEELDLTGAEVDFRWYISESVRLDGGLGLTSGEIGRNTHRPYTEGGQAPLTPDSTLNLGVQYLNNLSSGLELVLRLDLTRIGETWFHTVQDGQTTPTFWTAAFGDLGTANPGKTSRDPYQTVDARLTLNSSRWNLAVWARNLLDESYLMEVIYAPEFGGSFIHEAPEASFGVNFTWNFTGD